MTCAFDQSASSPLPSITGARSARMATAVVALAFAAGGCALGTSRVFCREASCCALTTVGAESRRKNARCMNALLELTIIGVTAKTVVEVTRRGALQTVWMLPRVKTPLTTERLRSQHACPRYDARLTCVACLR